MERVRVCAIIVTYNRKHWLSRCIEAVKKQSVNIDTIYVIDNASTDGTLEFLIANRHIGNIRSGEFNLLDVSLASQSILYYRLDKNCGGAGGFCNGLKISHLTGRFDAFWLMDDDGYPSENCLERQLSYLNEHDYVMPVSIDIDNHDNLSWATRKKSGIKTESYIELASDWGEVLPFIFPFNGSLLSRNIVDEVGYVKQELFIWGDDYEHYYRCLKKGFNPITVLRAIFYHPVNKAPTVPIFFKRIHVPFVDSPLRFVCLIRNWAYINKTNHRYWAMAKTFMAYSWLFLITRKLDLKGYGLYLRCTMDGLMNKFDRHLKYLK